MSLSSISPTSDQMQDLATGLYNQLKNPDQRMHDYQRSDKAIVLLESPTTDEGTKTESECQDKVEELKLKTIFIISQLARDRQYDILKYFVKHFALNDSLNYRQTSIENYKVIDQFLPLFHVTRVGHPKEIEKIFGSVGRIGNNCPKIGALSLHDKSKERINFSDLSKTFPNLRSLEIRFLDPITSRHKVINLDLLNLKHLKYLNVFSCINPVDLNSIENCSEIESINFRQIFSYTHLPYTMSLDFQERLPKLKKLSLQTPHTPTDFSKIKNLIKLYLNVAKIDCGDITNSPDLLTELEIRAAQVIDGSITHLGKYTNLSKFKFVYEGYFHPLTADWSCLGKCQKLESIILKQITDSKGLDFLNALDNLNSLKLAKVRVVPSAQTAINADYGANSKNFRCVYPSLKELHLTKCDSNILSKADFPNVESLSLKKINDLSILNNFQNIKRLSLKKLNIADIWPLLSCTNLTKIRMNACRGVKNWEVLIHIPSLKKCTIYKGSFVPEFVQQALKEKGVELEIKYDGVDSLSLKKINNLSILKTHLNLKKLYLKNLIDVDISPLLVCTNLTEIKMDYCFVKNWEILLQMPSLKKCVILGESPPMFVQQALRDKKVKLAIKDFKFMM